MIRTLALGLLAACSLAHAEEGKWVSLFNGKDLTGWTPKVRGFKAGENPDNTFRVEDGVLKVSYDKYAEWGNRYGHIFYNKKFSNYRLRLEYRFTGQQIKGGAGWAWRNSGIMIHSESPETMELNQDFPASLEVQLLGGPEKGERSTMNLCTPGTEAEKDGKIIPGHCTNSKSKTFPGDQWVSVEVEVHGNGTIKHFVNGEEVMSYDKAQLDKSAHSAELAKVAGTNMLSGGYFCLQSESHPVEFRKIEIMELDK